MVFEPMSCLDSDTGWQWADRNAPMKLESFRDFFGLHPSSRTSMTRLSSQANEAYRWNGRRIVMHCATCKERFEYLKNSETGVKYLVQGVGQLHWILHELNCKGDIMAVNTELIIRCNLQRTQWVVTGRRHLINACNWNTSNTAMCLKRFLYSCIIYSSIYLFIFYL